MRASTTSVRVVALDGLRGLAALGVVLGQGSGANAASSCLLRDLGAMAGSPAPPQAAT